MQVFRLQRGKAIIDLANVLGIHDKPPKAYHSMSTIVEINSPLISRDNQFINKYFKASDGFIIESSDEYFTVLCYDEGDRKTWVNVGIGVINTQNTPGGFVLIILEEIAKDLKSEMKVDGEVIDSDGLGDTKSKSGCMAAIIFIGTITLFSIVKINHSFSSSS